VAYLVNRALTVFANYTTSFGPVQNTQLNSQTSTNPLKPELAKTAELGARWKERRRQRGSHRVQAQVRQPGSCRWRAWCRPPSRTSAATRHDGIETALDYSFDEAGALAGLNLFANYTYTKAIQDSGATAGLDVPFYSRNTDTAGARYRVGAWTANLSSTHQTKQFSDTANTVAEAAAGNVGQIPGFRLWNAQLGLEGEGQAGL
jgi:Fe(3+) dicitrate transport protein